MDLLAAATSDGASPQTTPGGSPSSPCPAGSSGPGSFTSSTTSASTGTTPDRSSAWQLIGLAIYGVITGGIFGLVVYCRWKKLPVLRVLDATALAFPVAQIIGRCANIINGDTWGPPTKLPWGFTYTNPQRASYPANLLGVPTHPTPVYEQLWLLVMLGILLYLIPRLKTDGLAFLSYLGLYSLGRFFISFYRVNNIIFLGMREAQLFAVAGIILAPSRPTGLCEEPRSGPFSLRSKKLLAARVFRFPSPSNNSDAPTVRSFDGHGESGREEWQPLCC